MKITSDFVPYTNHEAGFAATDAEAAAEASMVATNCPFATEGEGRTTLYRAVGPNELADIQETGQYRANPKGDMEGKYFYPSRGQMQNFANAKWAAGKSYWGTSVEVTQSEMEDAEEISPLGEGRAFYFDSSRIPSGSVTILGRIH